ncbi:MAG: hypothetical protein EBS19_16240, partial [Spirochaetia bacterium]|nr:hypothetical protein [Spirochaetia bacterium]
KEAKRIVDGGGKVLIFAESVNDGSNTSAPNSPFKDKYKYKGTLPEIGKRLKEMGIKAEGLYGGSPTEAIREQNKRKIDGFNNGDTKIMYGNADTMGTGVSFDDEKGDAPRTILMMTPPFSAMDFVQVLGRINRLKTKSPAKVKLIGMENSPMAMVDEWMNQILRDKISYLGETVKGDISEFDIGGGKTKKVTPKESGNYINIDNYRTNPKPIKLDFGDQSTKKSKNWEWFLDHLHKGIEKKVDRLYEESY